MDQPYEPIDCGEHDVLLALATLRRAVRCTVRQPDGRLDVLEGVIEDVYTSAGAEYLRLQDGPTVRLDALVTLNGRPFGHHA